VLTLVEIHKVSDYYPGVVVLHVARSFALASVVGVVGGLLWAASLERIRTLKNAMFMTPAFAFVIYGAAEWLGCSGYIAALAFGITLGNVSTSAFSRLARFLPHENLALTEAEKDFYAEVAFLLKTFFFIYVGLTVEPDEPAVWWLAAAVTLGLLIVRIPVVRLALRRTTPAGDAAVMAAMVPKGLAAIVLASLPLQHGFLVGGLIQKLTNATVLLSIVATALLVFLLGKTPLGRVYGWFFSGFGKPADAAPEPPEAVTAK
jgi:potassium/hydrogen antiporter